MPRLNMGGSLARRLLLMQLAVVALTVGVFAAVAVLTVRRNTEEQQRSRVLSVAEAVAAAPGVAEALTGPDPSHVLQPIAERIRRRGRLGFVVVMSPQGIRYSHPNPARIGGHFVGTIAPAARGRSFTETYRGTLGPSVRAVVPVRGARGRIVGLVSVGVLQEEISAQLVEQLPALLALAAAALAVGIALSLLVARRVKRQTLGLEPQEIVALYEHHHATLHAIREGVLVLDSGGRLLLANDEARRLLGIAGDAEGRPLAAVVPDGALHDLLAAGRPGRDEVVLVGDRVLVVSQSTATVDGRPVGTVTTLRDRTELEGLVRELDTVRGMAESLRAQAHESANRLHTLVGLVELGRYEEAVAFATEQVELVQDLLSRLQERIDEPALVALLLGKTAAARERGIELDIADETLFTDVELAPTDLVTIVGNLIDNAVEAVAGAGGRGRVELMLWTAGAQAIIEVRDSGPGIPSEDLERVFEPGWTTKSRPERERGLGLALVKHTVRRLGGSVEATNDGGAVFTVRLPLPARPTAREAQRA